VLGMHGTVEWLPGSPLGSTADSWPDVLLNDVPNLYVYAANNPSESLLAKRRGYSTLVSHNVPPYARAGLYKELTTTKELTSEYRMEKSPAAIPLIAAVLEKTDLYKDLPFIRTNESLGRDDFFSADGVLTSTRVDELLKSPHSSEFITTFDEYCGRLWEYLIELENRIFSEGLHEMGGVMTPLSIYGYLQAVFADTDSSSAKQLPD
jgi:magnesium chelatase subunit H